MPANAPRPNVDLMLPQNAVVLLTADPQIEAASVSAESDLTKPQILVVDDQRSSVRIVIDALKDDFETRFALDGESALGMIGSDYMPDVILLDVNMPGMGGHEVCKVLKSKAETKHIPIIFVTGDHSEDSEQLGIDLGAVDYITKPISAPVLRARVRTHARLRRQAALLEQLAFVDGLTGIFNRRYFDQALQQEWLRAQRDQTPLALLISDLDHFKLHNDTYGHGAGDEALCKVGQVLRAVARRPTDVVARYGGEEFACLLPNTTLEGACLIAEALRSGIQALRLEKGALTISVGCAAAIATRSESSNLLLTRADQNLYAAKRSGRNRVCSSSLQDASASEQLIVRH